MLTWRLSKSLSAKQWVWLSCQTISVLQLLKLKFLRNYFFKKKKIEISQDYLYFHKIGLQQIKLGSTTEFAFKNCKTEQVTWFVIILLALLTLHLPLPSEWKTHKSFFSHWQLHLCPVFLFPCRTIDLIAFVMLFIDYFSDCSYLIKLMKHVDCNFLFNTRRLCPLLVNPQSQGLCSLRAMLINSRLFPWILNTS